MQETSNRQAAPVDEAQVFAIERPHPNLMTLYLIRSFMTGPFIILSLPVLIFRYQTMRYRFDREGISMSWGLLFRREINLTYARIQDIHVMSGPLLRWLGLAELHIQTASGSAAAEMTIEGIPQYEMLRDYLYMRMRGVRQEEQQGGRALAGAAAGGAADVALSGEAVELLREIRTELHTARVALETRRGEDTGHV